MKCVPPECILSYYILAINMPNYALSHTSKVQCQKPANRL